ncbi:unnamed protein product [Closterium sp. NIES-53]
MVLISDVGSFEDKVFVVTGGASYAGVRLCLELLRREAREVRCFDFPPSSQPPPLKPSQTPPSELPNPSPSSSPSSPPSSSPDPSSLSSNNPLASSPFAAHLLAQATAQQPTGRSRLRIILGDVRSPNDLNSALAGADCVFHIASFGAWGKDSLMESLITSINVDGTLNFVHCCLNQGVKSLVYTGSTRAVFGGQAMGHMGSSEGRRERERRDGLGGGKRGGKGGAREGDGGGGVDEASCGYYPMEQHTDSYGRAVGLAEQIVLKSNMRKLLGKGRLRTCVLRPAKLFGPGEPSSLRRIMGLVRTGFLRFRVGDQLARSDWLFVDNLVHAQCLAFVGLIPDDSSSSACRGGGDGKGEKDRSCEVGNCKSAGQAYFITDDAPVNAFDFLKPLITAFGGTQPYIHLLLTPALSLGWFTEAIYRLLCPLLRADWLPQPPILLPAEVHQVRACDQF